MFGMILNTFRFGEVEVDEDKILEFPDGLFGFEGLRRFVLLSNEDIEPFHWLQSIDDTDIALAVLDPFIVFPEYKPLVPESVFEELDMQEKSGADPLLLTVSVIPIEVTRMTTNLMSPIIINAKKRLARQIILETGDYNPREVIYERLKAILNGGREDARTDAQA